MIKNKYSIIIKVLSGFSLALLIIVVTGLATYKTLSQLVNTVSSISEPNTKLIKLKEIVNELSAAEEGVKAYTINQEPQFLLPYSMLVNTVEEKMNTLRDLTTNDDFHQQRIDTTEFLINNKLGILEEYILLKKENHNQDPVSKVLKQMPATGPAEKNKKAEESSESDFWDLFSSKNKTKYVRQKEVEDEWKETMKDVRKVISIARDKEKQQKQNLSARELELTRKDMKVMAQIRMLIDTMEDEEVWITLSRAQEAKLEAGKTILFVAGLSAAGIIIALLFVSFIIKDIAKSNRFKEKLLQARKNAETLAKTKEEFLANMSHEVRTPLNVIMGFTDQLLKNDSNENRQTFLEGIKRSSVHLLTIINDVLDYSKMESGKLEIETTGFRVSEVLEDIHVSLKDTAGQKNLHFKYELAKGTPEVLLGDPVRLKQVLLNLAGNAIKFTEKGIVEIFCAAIEEQGEQLKLKIVVKDTGIGISKGKLESVFQEFSQADTSTTRKYGGSGLGLAISRKLVEMQSGTISVESLEGKGSVFTILVPYTKGNNMDIEEKEKVYLPDFSVLKDKHVLIVDDEELNRYLAEFILEQWGVKVAVAANGKQAIEKHLSEEFDVILMDIQMPEMSGVEVVQHIRKELKGKKQNIPVIAVTANAIKGEEEKYLNAGMDEYISKPFKEKTLFTKLIKVMKLNKEKTAREEIGSEEAKRYDLGHLKKITKSDTSFLIKMLEIFIEHTPVTLKKIQEGINDENWEQVSAQAHKLGPSYVHLGMQELGDLLKKMETDAKTGDNLEQIPGSLTYLQKETDKAIEQLKIDVSRLKQKERTI